MKVQKLILCVVLSLCCLICSACQAQREPAAQANALESALANALENAHLKSTSVIEPMTIIISIPAPRTPNPDSPEDMEEMYFKRRMYYHLSPETVERYQLSVESCEGLTELGKIEDAGNRGVPLYWEYKRGEDIPYKHVVLGDTAYVHPQYPNLLVALMDGEPEIFDFNSFIDHYDAEEFRKMYGSLSAQKISIRVRREEPEKSELELELTITEPEVLTAFADAYNFLFAGETLEPPTEEQTNTSRVYYMDVLPTKGLPLRITYYPKDEVIELFGGGRRVNKAFADWFDTYVDSHIDAAVPPSSDTNATPTMETDTNPTMDTDVR